MRKTRRITFITLTLIANAVFAEDAAKKDDTEEELAMKLQNPVASLISVPFQNNWDFGIGTTHAMEYKVNVQPVIPISISDNWNLITRTIFHAESPVASGSNVSGLGDIVQSFFFSPKKPVGGWIMGGGPVFLYSSATDNALGGQKWGAGPTVVLLKQNSGWTYGTLANHIESFAGTSSRQNVSATFLQPFLSYTTKTYTTYGINTESTYDWQNSQWTVPVNATVSQLVKLGSNLCNSRSADVINLRSPMAGQIGECASR